METSLQGWSGLGAATLSDALDRMGLAGQCCGIRPLHPGSHLLGRAFTVRMVPASAAGGTVGDYIDDVPPGSVVVLDNGGRIDVTVWGDLLTTVALRRGLAGTVIHGVCRDAARSLELNYPLFSRGTYMRTGKDRVQAEGFNLPVSLGEVRVAPDDLVVGDADGVVVVPREQEKGVLSAALEIQEAEERIRVAVNDGMRLDQARKQFHYHQLQRGGRAQ